MINPVDTLPPIFVKVNELESTKEMLGQIRHQNQLLWLAIALIVVLFAVAVVYIIKYMREKERRENLVNSLLVYHAQTLPKFAETIDKISANNFSFSQSLYDDLQLAISDIKKGQKSNITSIVNDLGFIEKHPYLRALQSLTPQEKLVVVLYQEGFDPSQTSVMMGISPNGVRAIKTRIKAKLADEAPNESFNNLKILS